MKLVSAKCPNCNASIELNEKLEKGICQYCGETVYVKEALEKQKVEVTGNVSVTIDNDSKKIKNIKNYLKLNDVYNAKVLLNQVLSSDPFNLDALELKSEIDFNDLVHTYHLSYEDDNLALSGTIYEDDLYRLDKEIIELLNDLNKIEKIDDDDTKQDSINQYRKLYKGLLKEVKEEEKIIEGKADNKDEPIEKTTPVTTSEIKPVYIAMGVILIIVLFFLLIVSQQNKKESNETTTTTSSVVPIGSKVKVYVFYGETCAYCQALHTMLNELQNSDIGYKFEVVDYEVWSNSENNELMNRVASHFNTTPGGVPFYVIGDKYFSGYSETMNESIKNKIESTYDNNNYDVMNQI